MAYCRKENGQAWQPLSVVVEARESPARFSFGLRNRRRKGPRTVSTDTPIRLITDEKASRRIVQLLTVILLMMILAFCFLASSICITLFLASFLAILADPFVCKLERIHVPRSVGAGLIVLAGAMLVAVFLYFGYVKISALSDQLPVYADKIRQVLLPVTERVERVQNSAGTLVHDATASQAPELRVRETTPWSTYLVRGVGSVGGALVIAGVVPFLVYFMLVMRDKLYVCFKTMLGKRVDVDSMITRLKAMALGYVIGNLWIGLLLAAMSVLVFWRAGLKPAIALGIASGLLNLIPFVGAVLALAVPLIAGVVQFHSSGQFIAVGLTVIVLHMVAGNLLIPRFVGSRLDVGPVAATIGLMFWGWLWGIPGILLAVPLTAVLKVMADADPSLAHLSNLLARDPRWFFRRRGSRKGEAGENILTAG